MINIVIRRFCEKNHSDHIYEVGDEYPSKGLRSTKARIKELSTINNKYGKVYIQDQKDGE